MRKVFFSFICIFFCGEWSVAQMKYDFFISNAGNDANPGTTKALPKKTIAGTASTLLNFAITNGKANVGLKGGNIFEGVLEPTYPVEMGSYNDDSSKQNGFAILNGSDVYDSGWAKADSASNVFQQTVKLNGFVGNGINGIGQYSYVYVTEIDKELEKTAPFTARKPLRFVNTLAKADNTPGSFYEPVTFEQDSKKVFIHTTDGNSPNSNKKYRYEVSVRGRAVNSSWYENNRFENLWVRGYGAGQGSIPGGANSYYNKVIFGPGAAIHHINVRSGIINNSLFLPGPSNTNGYAVVFYDDEGAKKRNKISNSIFMDITFPIYAHTSSVGEGYGIVELDNVKAFNGSIFMNTSNVDSVVLNNVYTDNYSTGYSNVSPYYLSIKNSSFKDVATGIYFFPYGVKATISNVFIRYKNDGNGTGIEMQDNAFVDLSNSIIHISNDNASNGDINCAVVKGCGSKSNYIHASGNIFICDAATVRPLLMATTNTDNGLHTSSDIWSNNVYVLIRGKMNWNVTNSATNANTHDVNSFEEWKKQSGQDQNSLFFDLRNDPRGLGAIFIDPDNGDYELANTNEANLVRQLRAGMTDPITCFLRKPSYEEAAGIIMNNDSKILSPNSCKSPCAQNAIRVSAAFNSSVLNNQEIKLQWSVAEQQNIGHFEIERARDGSNYVKINSTAVAADSLYTFIDNDVQPGIDYKYRLVIVAGTGGKCYSSANIATIAGEGLQANVAVYPNPSTGKIKVSLKDYTGVVHCVLSNTVGQAVFSKDINFQDGKPQSFDLTRQSKGIYWLKLQTKDNAYLQKFLLQ